MAVETISQTYIVRLPRSVVWLSLLDPEILRQCIGGCEQFDADGNRFRITAIFKVGFLSQKFKGTVTLTDIVPEISFNFRRGSNQPFQGSGAFSGAVHLADDPEGTQMALGIQVEAGAALMSLLRMFGGSRIEARIGEFVERFEQAAHIKHGAAS